MIDGEQVGIVIKLREYIASLKQQPRVAPKEVIIAILEELAPLVEELQRTQWAANQLATDTTMGDYAASTIRRWKKNQSTINLFQTGELYESVKAEVDQTLKNMFEIKIDSPRYETNYVYLGKNVKIGLKEDGEPAFIGLNSVNTKLVQDEFKRMLRERGYAAN